MEKWSVSTSGVILVLMYGFLLYVKVAKGDFVLYS